MKKQWMTQQFFRMWPRGLFHTPEGRKYLEQNLNNPGVYVLYWDDQPYYIGKTSRPLIKRIKSHALKPNTRRYNFWNYFSAFELLEPDHRDEVEAILISAMPTANSNHPKFDRKKLDHTGAKMLNDIQALILTGKPDRSGELKPEVVDVDDDEE
jgi:hypothetical protein